jgi:type I restriction enzyme S subunit
MIPDGWRAERFADIANYQAGRTPARANPAYWVGAESGVPWVAISDMSEFGTVTETKERITGAALQRIFKGRAVRAGTLIMSFKLTIGRVATLGIDACHNEAIISIYPKPGIDQQYLGYFLAQADYTVLQDRQVKGNTLNQEKIDRIEVLVPPMEVQRSIAGVLDLIRRAIDLQASGLAAAHALKRAAMRELFTRGQRGEPQKETEIGLVPESWDVVKLETLGRIGNGATPKKSVPRYWEGGAYPWLTSAKVYDRNITAADQFVTQDALAECHLPKVKPGAVLVAITGQGKTLGHVGVLQIEATINQHLAYLQTNTDIAEPAYLRGYLETQYDYLRQVGAGGGSTKGALTCAFLRTLFVPLPSTLDEQRDIADILDAIDRKIDIQQRKRTALEQLFKALLHKLVAGEVSVDSLDLSALHDAIAKEAAA